MVYCNKNLIKATKISKRWHRKDRKKHRDLNKMLMLKNKSHHKIVIVKLI